MDFDNFDPEKRRATVVPAMRPGDEIVAFKFPSDESIKVAGTLMSRVLRENRKPTARELRSLDQHLVSGMLVCRTDDALLLENKDGRKHVAIENLLIVRQRSFCRTRTTSNKRRKKNGS